MIYGFASNFEINIRSAIAQYIFEITGEKAVGDLSKTPLDYYISKDGVFKPFV